MGSGTFAQLDTDSMLAAARERLQEGDLERAVRYLRAARSLDPDNAQLQRSLQDLEKQVRATIEGAGVNLGARPRLAVTMDQLTTLNVSAQEGFLLTRIDGSSDIRSLLRISPMPELEALIVFWKLQRGGYITV